MIDRRDLRKRLEALEGGPSGNFPDMTVVDLFTYEWEDVDSHRHLWRAKETGEIYHYDPSEYW